jgi:hypothetical protein
VLGTVGRYKEAETGATVTIIAAAVADKVATKATAATATT